MLGLENHGGVTEKASTLVGIVKELNSSWVGINLDTGNFQRNAYAQIESCIPYAVNVQFKTEIRDETGKLERADWTKLVGMLAQSGYRGYLALEYEEKENAIERVPVLTRELNRLAKRV
ncbi:MAG: TIM barrel protein [Bryobacteraceae bacterium]